jgi:hypothetical protein
MAKSSFLQLTHKKAFIKQIDQKIKGVRNRLNFQLSFEES